MSTQGGPRLAIPEKLPPSQHLEAPDRPVSHPRTYRCLIQEPPGGRHVSLLTSVTLTPSPPARGLLRQMSVPRDHRALLHRPAPPPCSGRGTCPSHLRAVPSAPTAPERHLLFVLVTVCHWALPDRDSLKQVRVFNVLHCLLLPLFFRFLSILSIHPSIRPPTHPPVHLSTTDCAPVTSRALCHHWRYNSETKPELSPRNQKLARNGHSDSITTLVTVY